MKPKAENKIVAPIELSDVAPDIEQKHVKEVYDVIAGHFSATRKKNHWKHVKEYLEDVAPNSLVLDVGCGSGKYFDVNPAVFMIGLDQSVELAKIASTAYSGKHSVSTGDACHLPYASKSFDSVISIAVLHHLGTRTKRVAMAAELIRVLQVGGSALISVWAYDRKTAGKRKHTEQDVLVPWHLQGRFADQTKVDAAATPHGKTEDDRGLEVFYRYYHFFKEGELEAVCYDAATKLDTEVTVSTSRDNWNWFVTVTKKG